MIPVLHIGSALVVLAFGMYYLEAARVRRADPLSFVFGAAWLAICLGAAGAVVQPFIENGRIQLYLRLTPPDLRDALLMLGTALLLIAYSLRKGPSKRGEPHTLFGGL